MDINFLELLQFLATKKNSNEYSEFLKFIDEIKNNRNQNFEISIPQNLIDDFLEHKSQLRSC